MFRRISAAVLIGGASRRMGRDKATLRWRGRPLVEHVLARLRGRFAEVLLIGAHPTLPGLPDVLGPRCNLVGIHSALSRARCPRVFVVGCDMPFVDAGLVGRLARRRADVVVPVSPDGPQPLHALWSRRVRGRLARRIRAGRLGVIDALDALGAQRVAVRAARPFRNFNTLVDLRGS